MNITIQIVGTGFLLVFYAAITFLIHTIWLSKTQIYIYNNFKI